MNNFEVFTNRPKDAADFIAEHIDCNECPIKEYCNERYSNEEDIYCADVWCKWFMEEYKEEKE